MLEAIGKTRRELRQPSGELGVLRFDGKNSLCRVMDISPIGAQVRCPDAADLPDTVELHIPDGDLTRAASVIWRRKNLAGLAF